MFTRILTGVVLAPSVFAMVAMGPLWGTRIFFTLAAALGAHEFMRMLQPNSDSEGKFDRTIGILATGGLVGSLSVLGPLWTAVAMGLAVMFVLLALLAKPGDISRAGWRAASLLATLAYVGSLFLCLALMTHLPEEWSRHAILIAFFAVWPGDTLAYFTGKMIGGKKLYPLISPKKTWSGSVGGVLGSIGGLFLLRELWVPNLTPLDCVVLGFSAGVLEQAGDLCESLFKRAFGVKDSGQILPGHGGILDRVDGLIFAAPVIYGWVLFMHV